MLLNLACFGLFDSAKAATYGGETWEHSALMSYWAARYSFASGLLVYAANHGGNDSTFIIKVVHAFEELSANGVGETASYYKDLGLANQLLSQRGATSAQRTQGQQGMTRAWTRFPHPRPHDE